jgi:hypothetical protein
MTSATTERPKLDVLRAKEAELAIEVDAARARIAEYPAQLQEAREKSWYSSPKARPGSELNGEVAKITARERKDLAALNRLEGDLSAVRAVIATEAARVALEEIAEARRQLSEFHEKEEAIWKRAAEVFGELAGAWNAYVTLAEEEDRFVQANGLDGSGILAVEPAPSTFKAFLLLLLSAATNEDVRSEPHTEQLVDSGVYGRRDSDGNDIGGAVYDTRIVGTRTRETRRRLDERDVLYHVVPDLRGVVRKLSLSGRVPKFTAE